MQDLNQFFKDTYCSDDPLDEDHSLTYFLDYENSMCYENKRMKTYKILIQKYGLTHGGSFESSWGYETEMQVNEEELKEYQNNSSYIVNKVDFLQEDDYHRIKGKLTPAGLFIPAKRKYVWNLGKVKDIEPLLPMKLMK